MKDELIKTDFEGFNGDLSLNNKFGGQLCLG